MNFSKLSIVLLTACGLICPGVTAARRNNRRGDIDNVDVPPVSQSGYTLPKLCDPPERCVCTGVGCNDPFPDPPENQTLRYLTLARGVNLYSCKGREPTEEPLFELESTTLWDAAPLIPKLASENAFHSLVPQLLAFDYGALLNSSLVCIGMVTTVQRESTIELYDIGKIRAGLQFTRTSPDPQMYNLPWTISTSYDLQWNIYRVKTYLGRSPLTCDGQKDRIQTDFTAEYWFYH